MTQSIRYIIIQVTGTLVCSTQPSASVDRHLESMANNQIVSVTKPVQVNQLRAVEEPGGILYIVQDTWVMLLTFIFSV